MQAGEKMAQAQLRQQLAQNYQLMQHAKRETEILQKNERLAEEQQYLDANRMALERDEQFKKAKQDTFKREQQAFMRQKEEEKMRIRLEKEKEREEYKNMIKQSQEKEIAKEVGFKRVMKNDNIINLFKKISSNSFMKL